MTQAERPKPPSLPDRIADRLLEQIFTGTLRPGQKLPPERVLAESLGVDRTSLRMALKHLQRLHLVETVQGSGVTVLDYREKAGIDFLAAIFAMPDVVLPGSFLVEVLDVWIAVIPELMGQACARATMADYRRLMALFDAQLAKAGDIEAQTELEVQIQDLVGALAGNTVVSLFFNSTRPIRRRLVRTFFQLTDVAAHGAAQRAMLADVAAGKLPTGELGRRYRAYILAASSELRRQLLTEEVRQHQGTVEMMEGGR